MILGVFLLFSGSLFSQAITFSFANAKMTDGSGGVGTTHYEVDVMISTDTDFKLGIGQFYIDYNSEAFGTNIFGGNLTFNHPDGVGGTYILDERFGGILDAYTPQLTNNETTKLSVSWTQALGSAGISTNVTTAGSPIKLAHLTILYVDNTKDPTISFDSALSQDLTFTAGPNAPGAGGTQLTDDTYDSSGAVLSNTWTGTTNTDWDTTTNWSLGSIPTGSSNVIIANVANAPIASAGISVNAMTINSDAQLTVTGAVTNNGTITVNSKGSFIAKTSVSGNITYNRNLGTTNWYLISSPVVGQDVDDFVTAQALPTGAGNNKALGSYNNGTPGWDYYQNGTSNTDVLISGVGRSIKLSATADISFTGTMNVSDVAIELTDGARNEFNLIGNPYPSYLAVNDLADGTNNLFRANGTNGVAGNNGNVVLAEDTIWIWDQSLNAGAGSYSQINLASSKFIAPGQGFFVKRTTDVGTLNFNFTEAMQSHQVDNFQKNANARPEIKISLTDGVSIKKSDIYYINGTTTGWDNGYDSTIFGGVNNSFTIYTQLVSNSTGQNLGIQSLPDSNYENMIIPLGINAAAGNKITISAESVNFPEGISVYIEDKTEATFTLLKDASKFSTTLSNDLSGIGRFYLHTTSRTLNVNEVNLDHISIFTSSKDNLRIVGVQNGNAQIILNNILGKKIFSSAFNGKGVNDIKLPNLITGIYIIQLKTQNGKLNKKIIIK